METVDPILSKMREPSCFKGKIPVECVDADFREFANRLEAAIKREREAVGKVVREMGGCCAVRVNCANCGKGEEVYFVPKGLITKLESVIAQGANDEQM